MREKKSEKISYIVEREFLSRCTPEEMLRRLIQTHLRKTDESLKNELENVASCGTMTTGTAVERSLPRKNKLFST
ncbi:MAG: hypothetical protein LUG61_05580 [Lachnospiraceae bacterium]|nr:hypothetical protein [Lachnospiraceae bacterium]